MYRLVRILGPFFLLLLPWSLAAASVTGDDRRLADNHPALAVMSDPAFTTLDETLAESPGYLGMMPAVDGEQRLVALFEGDAPATLPEDDVPVGWTLEAHGNLSYERLALVHEDGTELPASDSVPLPLGYTGIGPGSTLIMNFYDPAQDRTFTGLCTAAHIVRDRDTGKIYLSAAGHCFIGSSFSSTHGDDADWDPANTRRVRVCTENCLGGLSGLVSAARGEYPGTLVDIGVGDIKLDYARQSTGDAAVGHDYGIVEIPPEHYCDVRTDMAVWKGPNTADISRQVERGDVVVHYGNGVVFGEVFPTQNRGGLGVTSNANRWIMNSAASPGDSGSALNIATVGFGNLVEGEWAAGVLTHLVIGTSGGVIAGTNTARGFEMARDDAGFNLELVIDEAEICNSGEPVVTRLDNPDPAIEYQRGWHRRVDANASGGRYHRRLGSAGANPPSARLVFNGNAITYHYGVSAKGGDADVFIDGAFVSNVSYSGSSEAPAFGHSVTFDGLADGEHEILVVFRSGTAYVDGFDIVAGADGGAQTTAAMTRTLTSTQTGDVSLTQALTHSVEVGPDTNWLSVVVEGVDSPLVNILDPDGMEAGLDSTSVDGSDAVAFDGASPQAGTYTIEVLGTESSRATISVSRTTNLQ